MTAATATKTTAKSGAKKTATAKQSVPRLVIAASETKVAAPSAKVAKSTSSAKPVPTAKVAAYIESLTTPEERRFAAKQWRRAAGHRATEPSLRGVTPERAKSIRESIAAAIA